MSRKKGLRLFLILLICCLAVGPAAGDFQLCAEAAETNTSSLKNKKIQKKKEKARLRKKAKKTYTKTRIKKGTGKELYIKDGSLYTVKTRTTTTRKFCHYKGKKYMMVYTTTVQETTVSKRKSVLMRKVDQRLSHVFDTLGFQIIKKDVPYAGKFNVLNRTITVRNLDHTIFHELGHFLKFLSAPDPEEWGRIYQTEKSRFTGLNKMYVSQNESEFFAEAFRAYTLFPGKLKKECPQTYQCIQECLWKITEERVQEAILLYGAIWNFRK